MSESFNVYREKVYYSGSTLYYALLGYSEEQKEFTCAIYALFHEIQETFYRSQDPLPIRLRLQWWRDELSNLFEKKPTHPITRTLLAHWPLVINKKNHFFGIIHGFEACLENTEVTDARCLHLISQTIGNREIILAGLFAPDMDQATLEKFSLAIGLIHYLKTFYKNFLTRLQMVPVQELDQPKKIKKLSTLPETFEKTLRRLVQLAKPYFEQKPHLLFYKRRYKMAQALMEKYGKKPELMLARTNLTPIQKLFLCL